MTQNSPENTESKPRQRLGLHWLALLLAACGGSPSSAAGPDVTADCNFVLETNCKRDVACGIAQGFSSSTTQDRDVAACVAAQKTTLDCSRQTQETGNPQTCINDYAAQPCALFDPSTASLPFPASCKQIFK